MAKFKFNTLTLLNKAWTQRISKRFSNHFRANFLNTLKIFIALFFVSMAAAFTVSKYISYRLFLEGVAVKSAFTSKKTAVRKKIDIEAFTPILKNDIFGLKIDGRLLSYNPSRAMPPLSAKLIGTIKGGLNYAFFLSGQKIIFIKKGGIVLPGYLLEKVGRKSVVISYGGILETVTIATSKGFVSGIGYTGAKHFMPAGIAQPENSIIKKIGNNSYIVKKSGIKHLNMSIVYTQMHAVPNIVNGKISGYKVLNVVPGSIFWNMGLRQADVIKDINGIPLTNPAEAVGLLTGLQNENSLSLNILRGNSRITLNYKIE